MPNRLQIVVERRIAAPAEAVYQLLADCEGHPKILPPAMRDHGTEEGGYGAGTVHHVTVTLAGQSQTSRMRIDEPEPGRVIRETEIGGSSAVNVFTVDADGEGCHLQVESSWEPAGGFAGLVERLVGRRMFRRVLEQEFTLIEDCLTP